MTKLNVPGSHDVSHDVIVGDLSKTGDGKDIVVIGSKYFGYHREKPGGAKGFWSTTLEPFTGYNIFSGRSVTSFDTVENQFYGWGKRYTIDGENYLNEPYMPLAGDAEPDPWACTKVLPDHAISPDGGYTFYAVLQQGYDASSDSLSKCQFVKEGQPFHDW